MTKVKSRVVQKCFFLFLVMAIISGATDCSKEGDACTASAGFGDQVIACEPSLVCCVNVAANLVFKDGIVAGVEGTCVAPEDCLDGVEESPEEGTPVDCSDVTPGDGGFGESCRNDEDCNPGMPCCTSPEVSQACGDSVGFCECI